MRRPPTAEKNRKEMVEKEDIEGGRSRKSDRKAFRKRKGNKRRKLNEREEKGQIKKREI